MIDCSITENYLKEKDRMTNGCNISCTECPLSAFHNSGKISCTRFVVKFSKEAISIVQKWSDEHKPKTYKDDFFEKFPNAQRDDDGTPQYCRNGLYNPGECNESNCSECWNEPYEENKEKKND